MYFIVSIAGVKKKFRGTGTRNSSESNLITPIKQPHQNSRSLRLFLFDY